MAKIVDDLTACSGEPEEIWLTGEEMTRRTIERSPHMIQGVIGGPGAHVMMADPKAGKSRLALDACLAIATGRPFLGTFPVRQGPVLYWQADDTNEKRFIANYQALTAAANAGEALPNFEVLIKRLSLIEEGGLELIENRVKKIGALFVVIDCLQAVRGARSRDFVRQEFEEIRQISEMAFRCGCTALVIHHLASGRRASAANPFLGGTGTFALNGAADGLATLSLFSTTRVERMVHVTGRDLDGTSFVYGRDANGCLFFVADGEVANLWDESFRIFRAIQSGVLNGASVGEAIGCTDRQGRSKLAAMRAAGVVRDLSARKFVWEASFTTCAEQVIQANAALGKITP